MNCVKCGDDAVKTVGKDAYCKDCVPKADPDVLQMINEAFRGKMCCVCGKDAARRMLGQGAARNFYCLSCSMSEPRNEEFDKHAFDTTLVWENSKLYLRNR